MFPSLPGAGGDAGARQLGYKDLSDYNNAKAAFQANGGGVTATDPLEIAKQAQQLQVEANQPAIQTLQTQQKSLQDQYKELLSSVINQGSVALNTATSGENAYLGQRGLLSQEGLGNNQLSQAQQGVQAQNQSAAAQVGMGSAQDINALAAQIASLQAGNVQGALGFGGNISALANNLAVAQTQNLRPLSTNGLVYNPATNSFSQPPVNGAGTPSITSPNPLPSSSTVANNTNSPSKTIVNSPSTVNQTNFGGKPVSNPYVSTPANINALPLSLGMMGGNSASLNSIPKPQPLPTQNTVSNPLNSVLQWLNKTF